MSVMKEVQTNQAQKLKQLELNQRERMIVLMFRRLDEQSQSDIIRFLDALLPPQ
ncbi:hypothetical protein [Pseudomonas sp. 09C 129]|uniref:hypothetical protein n=1 Tax=Pseudomonas sp. 09C 129 TaxID=2054915 RepID=UPI0012FEDA27|nr:hypothetical protein [Pseudomonas sp. 09C 129]